MSAFAWVIVITAIAGVGGTGLGGVVAAMFKRDSNKLVSLLLSFAAGVMMSVVCFDLILDAIRPANAAEDTNIFIVIAGIMVGYAVIYALNTAIDRSTDHEVKHIDESHPRTADALDELIHSNHLSEHRKKNADDSHYQLFIAGLVMACAIALHNIPEGMVIGASYASEAGKTISSSSLALAIIIGLHNIPEGMAVAVPLITGGMSKFKAVVVTALSGAPTIIGAMIGYHVGMLGPVALALSLSFASGAMLYVVFGELLPEAILMWRSKLPALAVMTGIIVGLVIIFS